MHTVLMSMVSNVALAAGKITAGFVGHSYALIADGLESLADVFSSLVVYAGLRIAAKPPDQNHPYGHGKAEPMAGVAVAMALFGAAAIIFAENLRALFERHQVPAPFTLLVLAAVLVIKEFLYRYVMRVGEKVGSLAVKTDAWHHRADSITSALAFAGIAIALAGGPAFARADNFAAIAAAFIIGYNAWHMLRPALYELSDVNPSPEIETQVRSIAREVNGVAALDKCFVRKMGFDYYVDLHVEVDGQISVREGHQIAHQVKDAIRSRQPRIAEVLVHIEPAERPHSEN
jgi:cation diffusion facilitator family transporter